MVGREINDLFPKPEVELGDEMLRIEHLSRTGFFKDVSFNVHAGEIVGLTGLVGAGRTEVMEAVCGITVRTKERFSLREKRFISRLLPKQWKKVLSFFLRTDRSRALS